MLKMRYNVLSKDCNLITTVIMAFLLGLPVITISLDPREHGLGEEKKHQQQSVEKLHTQTR